MPDAFRNETSPLSNDVQPGRRSRWVLTYCYGDGSEVTVDAGSPTQARESFQERKDALPAVRGAFVLLTCDGKVVDEWKPELPCSNLPPLAPGTLRGLQRLAEYALENPVGTFGAQQLDVIAACVWIRQAGLILAAESEVRS